MKRRTYGFLCGMCFRKSSPVFWISTMLIVIFTALFVGSSFVDAHTAKDTYYTSICIEEGDTLLQIAKEYMTEDYDNCYDYMDEIRRINHLSDDDLIHADCYLVIPY